ncbi:MAG: PhoPQ-activated protein PqaA family protein, partial [Bacillota bacterium]|nr:PhoPQ-activated protein PqaA family protein [Bacillota bacterium]
MSNIKLTMITVLLAVMMLLVSASVFAAGELKSYIQKDDGAFDYSLEKIQLYNNRQVSVSTFNMTSQVWQGEEWKHTVQIYYPAQCTMKGTALLLVTGGNVAKDKTSTLVQACTALSAPVVILYNIPNQPLFEKNEDALIAYTFANAAKEDDFSEWPLLLPMVKSTVKAMDLVEEFTKDNFNSAVSQFIVAGASKRGWTTWLSAGIDDARVSGIAPLVFDFLKFPEQLAHEMECYGVLSDQLGDYSDINIHLGGETVQKKT